MASQAFEAVQAELMKSANMERYAAKGAIQLALMDAGLEAGNVTSSQMKVVVEKLLPKQLQSQKVANVPSLCERIRDALSLLGDDVRADSPDKVFQRLGA
jgi:hypothetical protein